MVLDIRTLVLLGAVIMAVSTAAFFSLYRFHFADKSPIAWGLSSATITLGCILLASRDSIAPFYSILAANMFFVLGYGLIWTGMRLFMERPVRLVPVVAAPIVLAPVLAWFTYVDPSLAIRSFVTRLFLALIPALIWRELRSAAAPPRYGRPQRVVAGLYAVETVLNLGFALAALSATRTESFLTSGLANAIYLLVCNIYMIIHILGVVVLYGERFRSELAAARDAAEAASVAKSRFLAHMSHELRTPLNGLIGMLDLARSADSDSERRYDLDLAATSAQSLLAIINDILDLSRLEAGKLSVNRSVFSLAPALAAILAPFEHLAASQGLGFTLSVTPPEAWIEADATRLRQIALNLIGNALKFTQHGRIEVSVRVSPDRGDGGRLTLSVADTGCGIPPDKLESIFENFSQTDEGEKQGGAGLGLTISRELARRMGGDIQVSSRQGEGSLFTLEIPCRLVDAEAASREAPPPPDTPTDLAALPRMHILLADDFEPNRIVIATLLRKAGHDVSEVADGSAAVAVVKKARFDLVLMDVGMPVMDGLEATRLIKEDGGDVPPIAALTAYALPGDRERFLAAGMDAYLAKPVAIPDLYRVLARFAPGMPPLAATGAAPVAPALGDPEPALEPDPKPGTAVIDWDRALKFMGGQVVELDKLCDVVEQVFAEEVLVLRFASDQGDLDVFAAKAHKVLPSLLCFGATALADLAREAEKAAKAGELARVRGLADELVGGIKTFLTELRNRNLTLPESVTS